MWFYVVHTELRGLENAQGAWVAQLVKCQTLDFSSGHDLMVCEIESQAWLCTGSVEPAWDFDSRPPLPAPLLLSLSLSKINKLKKIFLKIPFLLPLSPCPTSLPSFLHCQ